MCAAKFIADSSLPVSTTVVIHASSTPCALVVTALGYGLMMTAPHRPTEHCFPAHRPPGQDHSAQELAHFGDRQLHERAPCLLGIGEIQPTHKPCPRRPARRAAPSPRGTSQDACCPHRRSRPPPMPPSLPHSEPSRSSLWPARSWCASRSLPAPKSSCGALDHEPTLRADTTPDR